MTQPNNAAFLRLSGIGKTFQNRTVLQSIDLDIAPGESLCFLGPSGCGKTTLLRMIAGLETPDAGQILLADTDITLLPPRSRNFGMVFQSYSLFPHLTAGQNVAYGLRCRKWDRATTRRRVREMLDLVQLADHVDKLPSQLSGGQQQRVAIARALAVEPRVLLLDEPFSALDAKVRGQLRADMRALQRQLGLTTILVTHDQEEAMAVADRIVVMNGGRIEQVGTGPEIYHQPVSTFVGHFVGEMNILRVRADDQGRVLLGDRALVLGEPQAAGVAQIAIRPESIRIDPEAGCVNHFPATVVQSRFLGKQTRLDLSLDGQSLLVDVYGQRDRVFKPGQVIPVHLPPEEIRFIGAV
ncbi:hypothetical protein A9404_00255 [Halothiobacillus diazotrophicus]|uniref:ABC transporter domain-containing protein n=1 Tax=Halothiobacillus diazotrophicus TaxID=1860122 RepID=A0A191ZDS8_9GAMM|nr:ABC transporter ATP-binding protein [Halothiobacillus diazotrophicus]ANJ66022.1 hypothetical protein A9404_00255 [Halothiobacillus diazotrophicus]